MVALSAGAVRSAVPKAPGGFAIQVALRGDKAVLIALREGHAGENHALRGMRIKVGEDGLVCAQILQIHDCSMLQI